MNNYFIPEIDRLTGTTSPERQILMNWFAKQGEQTRLEAFKLQTDLAQQRHSEYRKEYRSEFYYAMLILALNKMKWTKSAQRQKQALTPEQTHHITEIRIARIKAKRKAKTAPQKELIRTRFYEEIKQLRARELSWREIEDYIAQHHKKKFSHGYLQQCFHQLTIEQLQAGVE